MNPDLTHLSRVLDVPIEIRVEVGRREITIAELLGLVPGQVVMLNRLAASPIDVFAAEKLIGQGDVVVIDEEFGVRITDTTDGASAPGDDHADGEPVAAWSRDAAEPPTSE